MPFFSGRFIANYLNMNPHFLFRLECFAIWTSTSSVANGYQV